MKPEPRVFTKDAPCTKFDLWQCFRGECGFLRVPTVTAHAQIGLNAPRVMEREGRVTKQEVKGVEYYVLTDDGEDWLFEGMRRFLKNHPSRAAEASHLPTEWGYGTPSRATGRLRRTR